MSNNTALMTGNGSSSEFYGVRPQSIPTPSLCVDKPVSKSNGPGTIKTAQNRKRLSCHPLLFWVDPLKARFLVVLPRRFDSSENFAAILRVKIYKLEERSKRQ